MRCAGARRRPRKECTWFHTTAQRRRTRASNAFWSVQPTNASWFVVWQTKSTHDEYLKSPPTAAITKLNLSPINHLVVELGFHRRPWNKLCSCLRPERSRAMRVSRLHIAPCVAGRSVRVARG